jgi:hypothetical protein
MNFRAFSPFSTRLPIVSALLALTVLVCGLKLLALFLYYSSPWVGCTG